MASTLIKDVIASGKSSNEWFKKVLVIIKSIENPTLYKYIKSGGWGENWAIPVFKDHGNGKADLGFGNQNGISSAPVRVTTGKFTFKDSFPESSILKSASVHSNKLANSEKIIKSGEFSSNHICFAYKGTNGKVVSALTQVSLLANQYVYEDANAMWARWKNDSEIQEFIDGIYDHEFCAMLDISYNCGSGYMSKYPSLKAAFVRHQKAKKSGDNTATATALQDVKDAMILISNSNGKPNEKLKIRRTMDANMYGGGAGGMSDYYDDESKWTQAVKDIYAGVPEAALLSINIDQAKKDEAAVSSLSAIIGTGYKKDLLALYGMGKSPEEILKEVKKQDEAQKKKEAASANKQNVKALDAIKKSLSNDDLNNLEFINDMRTLSGLTVPTDIKYGRTGAMSDGDRARSNMTHNYGMFKKYKHTNDEDLGQAKTTWFFLTRPDMCLYQNVNSSDPKSNVNYLRPSLQCADQDLIDHLIIDRDLYLYLDRNVQPEYSDTNICFIPSFTNQFKTANLPEARFDMVKSSANINGVAVNIPTYNSSDTADTEIPVTFNVDNEMSIIKYVDLIFKYAKSVKEGTTIPYKEAIKYNVIDFSMTMFAFVVGQDGVTLESMYRSVGVVPSVNPVSSIPLSSNPEKMESVTVSFKTNTNLDSRKLSIITHFNMLNRFGCSKVKVTKNLGEVETYDDAIDWYCLNYHIIESYIQDNMTAEDWYCERFMIYLDASTKQDNGGVYKLIGIPPMKRLEEIIDFLLNKSHNTFYNNLIVRETDSAGKVIDYSQRPGVKSIFFKRVPDITKIKADTKEFVKNYDDIQDFYKGWQSMARQADLDMRGDSEFFRNPGTGIRVLSNSKDKDTDGTMIFNLFKTIDSAIPARNNMYDLFLDNKGEIRDISTWMSPFYSFLNGILKNENDGKITNVITYAITGENTYSLDDSSLDPLKSNLGAVAISDASNTVYNRYSKGVKTSLTHLEYSETDKKYGIQVHKFNTISKIDKLGLFVDGLYIPELNDASKDIDAQLEKLENGTVMNEIKKENNKFRTHLKTLYEWDTVAKSVETDSRNVLYMLPDSVFKLGVSKEITKDDINEIVYNETRSMISRGASYYDINTSKDADKNIHFLNDISGKGFLNTLIKKTWENTISGRTAFNDLTINPNLADWYLSIEPDKQNKWMENKGIAPYLVRENNKIVAYNTKAVILKKEEVDDSTGKAGSTTTTKSSYTKASRRSSDNSVDSTHIIVADYQKFSSDYRYDLLSFMNNSIFTKKFTIDDWLSFYSPQGINAKGKHGVVDYSTTSSGEKILKKYHDIMFVSEWTSSAPIKYSDKGMHIHYSIGDIPADKLAAYNEFIGYYDVILDDMSDGALIETKNKATGEWDRTDKANKLFSYYPEDSDIILHENREKNSWTTKEGWKNRLNTWWGNIKTTAAETLWQETISLATRTLEDIVRKAYSGDEDRKDGKPVDNSALINSHKEYLKILERDDRRHTSRPRALYFKDPTDTEINNGLPELQKESVIKPVPADYYRSYVKLLPVETLDNIAKVTSEEKTSSKILRLLKDM